MTKLSTILNRLQLVILSSMIFMIPLVFSTNTRSVFEVNKLGILRVGIILLLFVYGLDYFIKRDLYHHHNQDSEHKPAFFPKELKWKRIFLEWPLIIWAISTLVSTFFSQNITISIYGTYDRWEGAITLFNYILLFSCCAKLIHSNKQAIFICWMLIISTFLSCFYGVAQALGYDLIAWSLDPTQRVFASINNPVHFCAYMGMILPLGIAGIIHMKEKFTDHSLKINPKLVNILIGFGVLTTSMIYFNMFLSFSRATWLGATSALTLFTIYALKLYSQKSISHFLLDFFSSLGFIAVFYLIFVFRTPLISPVFSLISILIFTLLIISIIVISPNSDTDQSNAQINTPKTPRYIPYLISILNILILLLLLTNLKFQLFTIPTPFTAILLGLFLLTLYYTEKQSYLKKILLVTLFAHIQFMATSIENTLLGGTLFIGGIILFFHTKQTAPLIWNRFKFILLFSVRTYFFLQYIVVKFHNRNGILKFVLID